MTAEESAELDAFLRHACSPGAAPGAPADTVERTDRMTDTPFRSGQRLHVAYDAEFVCYTRTGRAVVTVDAAPMEWRYEVPIGATLTPLPDPIKPGDTIPIDRLGELPIDSTIRTDAGQTWHRNVAGWCIPGVGMMHHDDDIDFDSARVLWVGQA
jgi:hypothetical protein